MIIGITGKIGAGKSTVSDIFNSHKWVVVNADKIGNSVAVKNNTVLKKLSSQFGKDIITPQGNLKKKVLRERAFKNKKTVKLLNDIVHPYLLKELFAQVKKHTDNNKNVLIDAALLLDWNLDKKVDAVIFVHANLKVRMKRMLSRGFSKEVVLEIDKRQKSFAQLRNRSDYLIYNSGTHKELSQKVNRLMVKLHK